MCSTSLLLLEEVRKNISALCDFSFVSKLTGDAGIYPFFCFGTKTQIFNIIQKNFNINKKKSFQH